MSMDYVRRMYKVPVKRGGRVQLLSIVSRHAVRPIYGTITRCTHRVWVRWDGKRKALPYHPTDPVLVYLDGAQ